MDSMELRFARFAKTRAFFVVLIVAMLVIICSIGASGFVSTATAHAMAAV